MNSEDDIMECSREICIVARARENGVRRVLDASAKRLERVVAARVHFIIRARYIHRALNHAHSASDEMSVRFQVNRSFVRARARARGRVSRARVVAYRLHMCRFVFHMPHTATMWRVFASSMSSMSSTTTTTTRVACARAFERAMSSRKIALENADADEHRRELASEFLSEEMDMEETLMDGERPAHLEAKAHKLRLDALELEHDADAMYAKAHRRVRVRAREMMRRAQAHRDAADACAARARALRESARDFANDSRDNDDEKDDARAL